MERHINPVRFFFWMRKLLLIWVKSSALPKDIDEEFKIDKDKPVCYILRKRSFSDILLLDYYCIRYGLPRPVYKSDTLTKTGGASYIYLTKLGIVQTKNSKNPLTRFYKLVESGYRDNVDVQLIPFSVFWGRDPGKDEKSWLKLLFLDDDHGGVFQKAITIMLHGRNVLCRFGLPISLAEINKQNLGIKQTARKLRRVLRVHFRTQKIATLGQQIYDRAHLMSSVLNTKSVRKAIEDEASNKNISIDKARIRARRYVEEIAAKQMTPVLIFFDRFLSWLWHKIYESVEVFNVNRLDAISKGNHEVVYLPCHRSHMDYLLIGHTIFKNGYMAPHVAAGINLNFWLVGPLLRRSGAFFIRRTFSGNQLYAQVFNEYVNSLLVRGFPVEFYPEGGRSRTGRMLAPKTGMVSMVVKSFLKNSNRPIVFVPIYVGYDKLIEGRSFLNELGGKKKTGESFKQLFKARSILKFNFGKAYVSFGKPIYLSDYLDKTLEGWKTKRWEDESNGAVVQAVNKLARKSLECINSTSVLNSSSLIALVLLSVPKKAMSEDSLSSMVKSLRSLLEMTPYDDNVILFNDNFKERLQKLEKMGDINRFEHPDGDLIFVDEKQSVLLTYYRNNIIHLYAVPAMIASYFQYNDDIDKDKFLSWCMAIYPIMKEELFLKWEVGEVREVFDQYINTMAKLKYLNLEGNVISRPDILSPEFNYVSFLGRSLGHIIERYAVIFALLSKIEDNFEKQEFENNCRLMTQRIAVLSGNQDPEFFDKNLFRGQFKILSKFGLVESVGDGQYRANEMIKNVSDVSISLLGNDIRKSITRIVKGSTPGA